MYPVSQTPEISLAGTLTWSEPLLGDIVNGQCPQSWNDLLFWLSIAASSMATVAMGNWTSECFRLEFRSAAPPDVVEAVRMSARARMATA